MGLVLARFAGGPIEVDKIEGGRRKLQGGMNCFVILSCQLLGTRRELIVNDEARMTKGLKVDRFVIIPDGVAQFQLLNIEKDFRC